MIVLLFGPPGCGKGTQAAFLVERLQIPAISTGEMLRAECQADTELGRTVRNLLKRGELIGDDVVNAMVQHRVACPDCARGFLLDGYPRTVAQAEYFAGLLREMERPDPLVIHLDVPAEELVIRLTARRQCPKCLRIYNLLSQPPVEDGLCDGDGTTLITRDDDRELVIRDRLRAYREQTDPVLAWYGTCRVKRIDGTRPAAQVSAAIEDLLMCPSTRTAAE